MNNLENEKPTNENYGLICRAKDFIHSINFGPFPGMHLYSFLASKQFDEFYSAIAKEIVELGDYKHILDINTGTGTLPIEIALCKTDSHIVGIDQSRDIIQTANINSKIKGTNKIIDFHAGDIYNIPYPGMYFDFAVMLNIFARWKKPLKILKSVYHVLKPGSEFRIYGFRKDISPEEWQSYRDQVSLINKPLFRILPGHAHRITYTNNDIITFAERSNFTDISIEAREYTIFDIPMPVFNMIKLKKPIKH